MKKILSVALALVMIFALAVSVAAKDSPEPKSYYIITVAWMPDDGSFGDAKTDKNKIAVEATGDDALVTLSAEQVEGIFTHWTIDGEYDVVEGDLQSKKLVIKPSTDIHAVAAFESSQSPTSATTVPTVKPTSSSSSSSSSPKTGDPLYIVLGLAVLALGAGFLAVKKIKE